MALRLDSRAGHHVNVAVDAAIVEIVIADLEQDSVNTGAVDRVLAAFKVNVACRGCSGAFRRKAINSAAIAAATIGCPRG